MKDTKVEESQYKLYPKRWYILLTVCFLNLGSYSHWMAFPSVSSLAAKYYDQTNEKMDLISTVSAAVGIPCCLIATYVVDKFGMRNTIHFGGILTGIGRFAHYQCGIKACISSLQGECYVV